MTSIYLFIPPYAIGSVPSLSGHAIAYRWRSLTRVRRHRASKPQGISSNGCCHFVGFAMDQLMCDSSAVISFKKTMKAHLELLGTLPSQVRGGNCQNVQKWEQWPQEQKLFVSWATRQLRGEKDRYTLLHNTANSSCRGQHNNIGEKTTVTQYCCALIHRHAGTHQNKGKSYTCFHYCISVYSRCNLRPPISMSCRYILS